MKKVPHGIQDFTRLRDDEFYYVDKTGYIRTLEDTHSYVLFTRPRRFGKSLWISILEHYYGLEYADNFAKLFGNLEIGKNPTPERNSCHILRFDFSGISDRGTLEDIKDGFREHIKRSCLKFFDHYSIEADWNNIEKASTPAEVMDAFLQLVSDRISHPIYVLIDEYDHFTHSLMAGRFGEFKESVTRDGFYRSFFEILKVGAKDVIRRIFMTGVTPVTLDAMTSGFNIAYDATREPTFEYMMGFTDSELRDLIHGTVDCHDLDLDSLVDDLRDLYNGYRFTPRQSEKVYNPAMALHYIDSLSRRCEPPVEVLTASMSTDAGKLRELALTGDVDANLRALEKLALEGEIASPLVQSFSMHEPFGVTEFISMLYYIGVLTIEDGVPGDYTFVVPNSVVHSIHLRVLLSMLEQRRGEERVSEHAFEALRAFRRRGEVEPVLRVAERFLGLLSSRDRMGFSDKHVKLAVLWPFALMEIYLVHSEYEVVGIPGRGTGYVDVYVERRDPAVAPFDVAFELKYVKTGASGDEVEARLREGEEQMRNYLKSLTFSGSRTTKLHSSPNMESVPAARDDLLGVVAVYQGSKLAAWKRVGPSE